MKQVVRFFNVDLLIILSVVYVLSACGGGGGGSEGGSGGGNTNNLVESFLHGSVGDGPIVGASVRVLDKDNNLLSVQTSDNTANYQLTVRANRNAYPLTMEAVGGQDIVTGGLPDFTLRSVVLSPAGKKRVNINPFTTFIIEIAENMSGGLTEENVAAAKTIVLEQINFSYDQSLMSDPVTSDIDETNIAMIIRSSEALGEMLRRARDALQSADPGISADQVIYSLSADLIDGVIDGRGAAGVDARIAAVSNIASAQVLVEVITGQLKVNDVDATLAMNNAVLVSRPGIDPNTSINGLPVVNAALTQTIAMLAAAEAVDANPVFTSAKAELETVQAGALPVEVAAVLSPDVSTSLSTTLMNVVSASDAELEQVNMVVRSGGEEPVSINTAPLISGAPMTGIEINSAYLFAPTASDADGDVLSFSVSNLPTWASFNPVNGAISGTPGDQDIGVYNNIALTVSDGIEQAALPVFSITVTGFPNSAPTISGAPQINVEENSAYLFAPTASDADGDVLSFSVSNLPTWASFNPVNGAISGTPGDQDIGVYNNIALAVSDGIEQAALPVFSITVTGFPNSAPTISGMPQTSVEENSAYLFVPTASDADGDVLSFSVSNLPAWASFNPLNGAISGTPTALHVGVANNIVVSVSDGTVSTALNAFDVTVTAISTSMGSATLSWMPPTENTDGSSLTDLAGYKIYYGTTPGTYSTEITVDNPGLASYVVDGLPGGATYYFVITAYTTSGLESEYSTVGSKFIP